MAMSLTAVTPYAIELATSITMQMTIGPVVTVYAIELPIKSFTVG